MLVDAIANATLDAYLGATTILPATVYIGLMTAAPNPNGTGVVEPIGNGYTRMAVANNPANWPAASARTKTHTNDITFPTATGAGWGTCTHVGIFDALSGGNLRLYDALAIPRLISATDIDRFLAGGANALKVSF
jgi:hypothetical protein